MERTYASLLAASGSVIAVDHRAERVASQAVGVLFRWHDEAYMKLSFPGSARYGIPLVIIAFTAVLAIYTVQRDRYSAEAIVRGAAVTQMMRRMTELQQQVAKRFESGVDADAVDGPFTTERDTQLGLLLSEHNLIIGSTSKSWVGQYLDDVLRSPSDAQQSETLNNIVDRVRKQDHGEVHLAGRGRYVLGVYPVPVQGQGMLADKVAARTGVLIVHRDLSPDLSRAWRAVRNQTLATVAMLGGLGLVLTLGFHFLVARRLNVLVTATRQFALGNFDTRAGLHGRDEVAILGYAFDRMAEQVADNHRQLEQRVLARTLALRQLVEDLRNEVGERKRVETALINEKERIQITLKSIGEAVVTTDLAGRVDYLNPEAEKLMGRSASEVIGKLVGDVLYLVNEMSGDPVENPVARALEAKGIVGIAGNTVLICADGKECTIDGSVAPINDHQGVTIGAVLVFRDVPEAHRVARQLSYQASHDALTGLYNRAEFERRVENLLLTADNDESHAMLYIDLDQFKIVNDACGHAAGDELLRQISTVLSPHIRKRDTLARLGGDEFGVLLEHCSEGQALRIAEEIREGLHSLRFIWQDRHWPVGASIGLVPIRPETDTLASILRAADLACYVAKEFGRNRVHVYQMDDGDFTRRQGEMRWIPRIQEALAGNWFTLYCQPIVPLRANDTPHSEMLLRLRTRDGALVHPAAFIPAAERYNQMQSIDRWVIRSVFTALRDVKRIPASILLTVNLSGQSLSDRNFLEYVQQEVEAGGISLDRVCFEVTETAAITNFTYANRFFSALREHGCRFALDDFGCGLSSFSYLKMLPVDFLKIDGSFVKDMARDATNFAMVEAIHRIGHVMGIETIAECVESEEVLVALQGIGVDYAQGYALARPMPLDDMTTYFETSLQGQQRLIATTTA